MKTFTMGLIAVLMFGLMALPAFAQEANSDIEDIGGTTTERPEAPDDPADDPAEEDDEAATGGAKIAASGGTTEVAGVSLARTGIELTSAALLAVALLGAGLAALLVSRRRTATDRR